MVGSLVFGIGSFWNADLSLIQSSSNALVAIAAVVFAILGVWITALNPLKVFRSDEPRSDSERELIDDLQPFFRMAVLAFSAVVVLRLLVFVVPLTANSAASLVEVVLELLNGRGQSKYVFEIPEAFNITARIIAGISIVFLFFVEAVLVMVNLKPLFEANKEQIARNRERSKQSNNRR